MDGEVVLYTVLRTIREYLEDCESDIEGCTGEELTEIEHCMAAARMIRDRAVDAVAKHFGDERVAMVAKSEEAAHSPIVRFKDKPPEGPAF